VVSASGGQRIELSRQRARQCRAVAQQLLRFISMRHLPLVFVFGLALTSSCESRSSLGSLGGDSGWHSDSGTGGNSGGVGGGHGGSGGMALGGGGRGGSGGAGVCQPVAAGGGVMTWDDNGVAECGSVVVGEATGTSMQSFISISGTTAAGLRIEITVLDTSGLSGSYSCKNDASVNDLYVNLTYSGGNLQDCAITIDTPGAPGGAPATGSFSATLTGADGGAIDLTNGTFDTPVFAPPP
jgi:hypothetical protein